MLEYRELGQGLNPPGMGYNKTDQDKDYVLEVVPFNKVL